MDLVGTTNKLPSPGETITGESFMMNPGGKGANQAVALARLGAEVQLVGKIGNDIFGKELKLNLECNAVNIDNVATSNEIQSGIALILLNADKENHIVVIPGSNATCNSQQVQATLNLMSNSKCLLIQFEIPIDISIKAAQFAQETGVTTILDPSPCINLDKSVLGPIDIITPNQYEAEYYTGIKVIDEKSAKHAANILKSQGASTVIITLGAQGAYYSSTDESGLVNARKVNAVDTVGAGDAFNAGLAVAISKGSDLQEAIQFGVACGNLAVTKLGAQNAMPYTNEVSNFINKKL